MSNDTTVSFLKPAFRDEMTDLIRAHAQTAIRQAVFGQPGHPCTLVQNHCIVCWPRFAT